MRQVLRGYTGTMRLGRRGFWAALAGAIVLMPAPSAVANDTICSGSLSGGVYDNVVVPANSSCFLDDARVTGSIKALENSMLAASRNQVGGSIDGDKAETVQLVDNRVGGSIQVKEGEAANDNGFDVFVCGNSVAGSLAVEKMSGSLIVGDPPASVAWDCSHNLVRGNIEVEENTAVAFPGYFGTGLAVRGNESKSLQVSKNRGSSRKTVRNNTAGQISCTENRAPFRGGANNSPNIEGQCI